MKSQRGRTVYMYFSFDTVRPGGYMCVWNTTSGIPAALIGSEY